MLPFNLLRGLWQARQALQQVKPDVVLGMGGYITFPGGVMARLQDLLWFCMNRIRWRVWLTVFWQSLPRGWPPASPMCCRKEWLGNPVRPEIAALPAPAERLEERSGALRLLVIGGSLGAQALNERVPLGMAELTAEQLPQIVHQAGEKHIAALETAYAEVGVSAYCVPFIEDMAGAYDWADLVICRARVR